MEPKIRAKLTQLTEDFLILGNWTLRYQVLVEMGRDAPGLEAQERTDANLVPGCLSPVWLTGSLDEGLLYFRGDSTGVVPKGLAALVTQLFSGLSATEILSWDGDLAQALDLKANLTATRAEALERLIYRVMDLTKRLCS